MADVPKGSFSESAMTHCGFLGCATLRDHWILQWFRVSLNLYDAGVWELVLKNSQAFEWSGYLGDTSCVFSTLARLSCDMTIVTPFNRFPSTTKKQPTSNPPKQNKKKHAKPHRNHLRNPLTPTSPIPAFALASGTLVTTESDGRWCRGFHRRSVSVGVSRVPQAAAEAVDPWMETSGLVGWLLVGELVGWPP